MPSAVFLLAPGLLALAVGAAPMDLAGPWRFQAGDDPAWAAPGFDDAAWATVAVPTGWGRESPQASLAWYRLRVKVDPALVRTPPGLAVLIEKVDSAYEIYAGGLLLGGVGALPPEPRMDYDRHATYVLPPSAVDADGRVLIALRVWKSPDTESSVGGPVEGRFLLAPSVDVLRRALLDDMLQLFLGALFVLVGLYHLHLFRRRPTLREYLWYALVAIDAGLYCLLRTQWKYAISDHFVLLKEIEYVVLLVLPPLFVQFVWPLLGVHISRPLRLHQLGCVALALLVGVTPGLRLNTHALPYWELSLLPLVIVTFLLLARETRRKNPEARTIILGLSAFMAFAIHDVAVDRGIVSTPRVTAYGFAALVLSMAVSLANRFSRAQGELAALSRELELRVVARTQDLSRRTEEAAAANRAKSQFLATMSHELRTPLNAVIGMTGLVLDSPLNGEQRESLEIVRRSGEALLALVNDILDFSKVESGKLDLEAQPFSLRTCIEESLELVAARAAEKGLDLAYLAGPDVPHLIRGDMARVRQVLVNLVNNATKFTPSGGVMITASAAGDATGPLELTISVADTGIGIPEDRRDRLFRPFSQVDASHAREYGGTGLGLAISHRLCELMGGRLWLGEAAGPGSVFHFTFRSEAAEADPPLDLRHEQPHLAGKAALVVSAGPFTRRMIDGCLRSWGMSVRVATSNAAALEVVGQGEVHVALIGFGRDGEGARTAELLRGLASAGELPFVAYGPLSAREQMRGAVLFGIAARLVTPLRPAHLHGALLEAFGVSPPTARSPETHPVGRAIDDGRPLRILLADDSVVNQKVALQMLERQGYRADVAGNGREVLEALGRQTYDVVLLDVQMPEMDGLEAARRIRVQWNPGPRLIAMTANALQGDRETCLAAGMDDYLSKPVSQVELAAALRRCWPKGSLAPQAEPPKREAMPTQQALGDDLAVLASEPLAQLRRFEDANNPTLVADIIREFLREAPLRLASMEAALGQNDRESLEFLAHNLKGSAGMIGGRRLQASCSTLEQAAHDDDASRLPSLLAAVHEDLAALREELGRVTAPPVP